MANFLVKCLLDAVPVVFIVVLLVFMSLHVAQGDPVDFIIGPDHAVQRPHT